MFPVWVALRTGTVGRQNELSILCLNCKLSLTLRQQSPAGNSGDPVGKHSTVPLESVNTRDASWEREAEQTSLLPHARALNYVIWASPGMSYALFSIASCRGWEIAIKHYERRLSSPYAKTLSISHRFFFLSDSACQYKMGSFYLRNWELKNPCFLTLIVLMWRIGWAHNNARK